MTQQYPPPGGGYGPPPPQPPPYGQQPPPYGQPGPQGPQFGPQQPFGPPPPQQPPYGGPPPPPGMQPGYTMGGEPPKRSSAARVVKGLVALVLVGGLVYFGIKTWGTSAANADVGDCIKVNSASEKNADVEKIDCNSPDAVYKVAIKQDSADEDCPTQDYLQYLQSGKGDDFALCLMLNAKQGDCFKAGETDEDAVSRAECTDKDALQVTKIVTGTASDSACPDDTAVPLVYPQPGETICLSTPSGGGQGT